MVFGGAAARRRLRRPAAALAALLWILGPLPAPPSEGAAAGRAEEVVTRLQEKYDENRTLTADFIQINELRSLGRTTRSKGRLMVSKPGRLRVEYTAPERQLIVSDGERLWIYTERLRQVIESRLAQSGAGPTPLLFLAGKGDLKKNFRITLEDVGVPPRAGGVWRAGQPYRLMLEPRRPNPAFQRMWLEVDPGTFQITALAYLDALGNRSRLEFSRIREGIEPHPGWFQFTPPPNTDVLQVPGARPGGR